MEIILKILSKINLYLYYFLKTIGIILLALTSLLVFISVIYRYVLLNPIRWSGELARIFFVWFSMIGATIALKNNSHASVDIFVEKLPENFKPVIYIITRTIIIICITVLIYYGFMIVETASMSTTPALRISSSYLFISIPISGCFMLLFCIENILKEFVEGRS